MGSAMGSAISGSILTNDSPQRQEKYMPGMSEKVMRSCLGVSRSSSVIRWEVLRGQGLSGRMGMCVDYHDYDELSGCVSDCNCLCLDIRSRDIKQVAGWVLLWHVCENEIYESTCENEGRMIIRRLYRKEIMIGCATAL